MIEHLYVHVPFCKHICYYCDFAHTVYQEDKVEQWISALETELQEKSIGDSLKTMYIGGGTPTALSSFQLERVLRMLFPYSKACEEYTIEINPETMDADKCALLKKYGINRVSIGMQAAQDDMLVSIGRKHTYMDLQQVVGMLKKVGITNISLDIMYSLPNQTMEMLQETMEKAISLSPKHISLYSLTIEPNTVFEKRSVEPLDPEKEADMYDRICQYLPTRGYQQYEISNFAIPGYESKHNLGYWHYDDFYGISCGASGKEGLVRYDKPGLLSRYLENSNAREDIALSQEDAKFEMVMMSLRLMEGMKLSLYEKRFGSSFPADYGTKVQKQIEKGLLEYQGDSIRCTRKGFPILNDILVDLMD